MPGGRPTKYTPELLESAKDYLSGGYTGEDNEFVIPSITGLAMYVGISRDTAHTWRNEEGKEAFSDILENILGKQELLLVNKGLTGEFNSNITKLALGKHGYSDQSESKHTGDLTVKSPWDILPVQTQPNDS